LDIAHSALHYYVTIGLLYVEQLYTDSALVLDASTRVAAASGSGAIDLHFMHKHTLSLLFPFFSEHLMLALRER
jgi:Ni,Fe-hydrogenase I cytochrome b subunit